MDNFDVEEMEIDGTIYQVFNASSVWPPPAIKLNNITVAHIHYTYDCKTTETTYEIRWL